MWESTGFALLTRKSVDRIYSGQTCGTDSSPCVARDKKDRQLSPTSLEAQWP